MLLSLNLLYKLQGHDIDLMIMCGIICLEQLCQVRSFGDDIKWQCRCSLNVQRVNMSDRNNTSAQLLRCGRATKDIADSASICSKLNMVDMNIASAQLLRCGQATKDIADLVSMCSK